MTILRNIIWHDDSVPKCRRCQGYIDCTDE